MNLAEIYIEAQPNSHSYQIDECLSKGTLFPCLYIPYKYENNINTFSSKKENMFSLLENLDFAILEMNLYMITHKDDLEAVQKLNDYIGEFRKIKTLYENQYGPLCANSQFNSKVPYALNEGPWPWEVK